MQDVRRRVARVFVGTDDDSETINGYYTLNAASYEKVLMPTDEAKRLPHYPVPATLIGRFAVDQKRQGQGIGEILLIDAINRVVRASSEIAIYAIVVDAKNDVAARFYKRYGFQAFTSTPNRLYLSLATFEKLHL